MNPNWLEPPPEDDTPGYDMSRGHILLRAAPCPRCTRPVLNICLQCGALDLAFYKDMDTIHPERGVVRNWTYFCRTCGYIGLAHYCSACLCVLTLDRFVREPAGRWLPWACVAAAALIGLLWP